MRVLLTLSLGVVLAASACSSADAGGEGSPIVDGGDRGDGAKFTPPAGACDGPLGKPRDPASLPACCTDFPGTAHCVSTSSIPSQLQSILAPCDAAGSQCVPDEFIKTGGVFTPKTCTAFGGEGRCVSQCIPEVADKAALLLQDVCNDWEKCVPCVSPLDHKPTGVCEISGHCNGEDAGPVDAPSSVDSGPAPCPHVGPPVIDPTKLPACQCPDAHCVSKSLVPPAEASQLATCSSDATGLCVPDTFIASGGNIIPATCASIDGAEGRCLSTCLPQVAAQLAELPQSTCATSERCVPCYDPISLTETGACRLSCDPGPKSAPKPFPKCCSGNGSCVPASLVPTADASALQKDKCTSDTDLCVPDVFLHKTWSKIDCEAATWLGDAGPGVCMPDCIKGMSFLLLKGACPSGMKCAPCKDPLSGKDTGACEFHF